MEETPCSTLIRAACFGPSRSPSTASSATTRPDTQCSKPVASILQKRKHSCSPTTTSKVRALHDTHSRLNTITTVSHRVRKFQDLLADTLENFRLQKEGLILRIPRLVRDVTLREFAKYNGDVQACLQGLQRERLGGDVERIDKSTRKRKWVESQETEARAEPATDVSEPLKAAKSGEFTSLPHAVPVHNRPSISPYDFCNAKEETRPVNRLWNRPSCATTNDEDTRHSKFLRFPRPCDANRCRCATCNVSPHMQPPQALTNRPSRLPFSRDRHPRRRSHLPLPPNLYGRQARPQQVACHPQTTSTRKYPPHRRLHILDGLEKMRTCSPSTALLLQTRFV